MTAGFSQARIPVNEPNTGGNTNTKPNTTPTTTNHTTTTSSELKKYSDPQSRFTIGYPGDWKFEDKTESAVIKMTSPSEGSEDKFSQNLNLQIEALTGGTTIEQYVKANMDGVKEAVKGYREVSAMYFNRNGIPDCLQRKVWRNDV